MNINDDLSSMFSRCSSANPPLCFYAFGNVAVTIYCGFTCVLHVAGSQDIDNDTTMNCYQVGENPNNMHKKTS